jgi:hypothetical protein
MELTPEAADARRKRVRNSGVLAYTTALLGMIGGAGALDSFLGSLPSPREKVSDPQALSAAQAKRERRAAKLKRDLR